MSNPFDDLKADEAETDTEDPEPSDPSEAESVEPDSSTSADTASSPTTQSSQSDSDSTSTQSPEADRPSTSDPEPDTESSDDSAPSDPADTGPAFEYSEVRQKPLYARDETWNNLEDELGITVTPELRRMGIRDEETRELHDAILKVAIEHVDELPELIAEARRRSD